MGKFRVIIGIVIFFVMLLYPEEIYNAAIFAIDTWWNNVIPALLPFFILSEFLMTIGLMEFMAFLLEPVMRPLFRLSGGSALAVVMGFVSGTPTAANITATLYKQNLCTKDEAERLLAFTNNAGPLYILVAVAVGILQTPEVGIILFLSHYPINLFFGIILKFFAKKNNKTNNNQHLLLSKNKNKKFISSPNLSLGKLLNIVIKKALINIGIVGGFMVVFGILTAAFDILGITHLLTIILSPIANIFGIDTGCLPAMAAGFWEMTIGMAVLPKYGADMLSMLMAAAMILAWNGISIQSQVAAMVADTDLKLTKYRICRIIHSILAPIVVMLLYKKTAPVLAYQNTDAVNVLNLITPTSLFIFSILLLIIMGLLGAILFRTSNKYY